MRNIETRLTINMFKCECYPNHEICKNKNTCEFQIPLNPELLQLYRQLTYELAKLNTLKQRKQEYYQIAYENPKQHAIVKRLTLTGNFNWCLK